MVLLDTCALIWLVGRPTQLSHAAREAISAGAGAIFVSAISAWEVAIKTSSGKLGLPKPPERWYPEALEHHGLEEIPVSGAIAIASASLPRLHNDPADRLLIATALERAWLSSPRTGTFPNIPTRELSGDAQKVRVTGPGKISGNTQ